jgi:hypothetical protein
MASRLHAKEEVGEMLEKFKEGTTAAYSGKEERDRR